MSSPLEESKNEKRLLSDEDEVKVKSLFLESALLPMIEAAYGSGSILEMAKEYDLFMALLSLTETFAQKRELINLLVDIGEMYEPR